MSWSHLLGNAWAVTVDLPASWLLDQLARPPTPDFSDFDIEAKRKLLRGEIEEMADAQDRYQWWSPVSWMDKTEEWIQTWTTSAYQAKKTWDEMVAAKQAERDRMRSQDDFSDDSSILDEEDTEDTKQQHIIPTVIIDENKQGQFVKNSPQNYAKISKKLAAQVFPAQEEKQQQQRQNWRNKEIRSRSEQQRTSPTQQQVEVVENFTKTYSFRNLPKGRVAEVKQMFDHNNINGNITIKRPKKTRPAMVIPTVEKERKERKPGRLQIPIQAWEDKCASQPELSVVSLAKPRSRQGFHLARSTPSVMEDSYFKEYLSSSHLKPTTHQPPTSRMPITASECKASVLKQPKKNYQREKYYAFENVDLHGRVLSWTEIISIHSVYDISISEPVFV